MSQYFIVLIAGIYFFLQTLAFLTFNSTLRNKAFGPASAISTALVLAIGGAAFGYTALAVVVPLVLTVSFAWIAVISYQHVQLKRQAANTDNVSPEEDRAMREHLMMRAT